MVTTIDLTALTDFSTALAAAPKNLLQNLAKAYQSIGSYDIERIRGNVSGALNLRSRGAANSFKFRATDTNKATGFNKLFTDEYTGWKAAGIFQTGGVISGKGKMMTILTPEARRATGKRFYTQAQLRSMIASGQVRFIPSPIGILLVKSDDLLTKTGKIRHNRHNKILAILKRSVTEKKRISFYETAEGGESIHQEMLSYAIEDTLVDIATGNVKK